MNKPIGQYYNFYRTIFSDTEGTHTHIHITPDKDTAEDFAQKIEEYWQDKGLQGNVQVWRYQEITNPIIQAVLWLR